MTSAPRRKICVVLVDRANYGRLKPVMRAIAAHPGTRTAGCCRRDYGSGALSSPVQVVREDGFQVDGEIYIELEGSTPATMAKSVGFGVVEFASEFQRLKPDMVLLIGDRYEALAAAIAAAYMNICIAHIQGGEVSGSIDESARHAITKFAHFHFPSTQRSAEYLVRMGENPETHFGNWLPEQRYRAQLDRTLSPEIVNTGGSGALIDVAKTVPPCALSPDDHGIWRRASADGRVLAALNSLKDQTILLWPNIDAGADHISKAIRVFRDQVKPTWLRTLTNLSPENYLKVLSTRSCAIGNSSSFVRDASYFGTPVVLVGSRQDGRETDEHVMRVDPVAS